MANFSATDSDLAYSYDLTNYHSTNLNTFARPSPNLVCYQDEWNIVGWGRLRWRSFCTGQKLILEENKVKCKSWSLVLISTDMGSVVSPRWDNDHPQNLVILNSVVCQHLVDVIQFCRFWERLTSFIHACLETLGLNLIVFVFYVIAKKIETFYWHIQI